MADANKNMAPCRTCGEQIAKTAQVCPKCGEKKPIKHSASKRLLVYSGIILALCLFAALSSPDYSPGFSGPQQMELDIKNELAKHCQTAIRTSVANLSTLDMDSNGDYKVFADGTKQYVWGFSAKNGFGLKLSYNGYCTRLPNGEFAFDTKQREQ